MAASSPIVRVLCVGTASLAVLLSSWAYADAGTGATDASPSSDVAPGGLIYSGLGIAVVGALSPGYAGTYDLSLEWRRALVNLQLLGGNGVNGYQTLLASASFGMTLSGSNNAPYLLGGMGYLARGSIPAPESPTTGSRRDHVVLVAEGGYLLGRSRRFGQVWLSARAVLPVATVQTRLSGPMPDLPFALLTVRFLL